MARTPKAQRRRKEIAKPAGPEAIKTYEAFCPCCGMLRSRFYRGSNGEHKEAWNLEAGQRKYFGLVYQSVGRGNLQVVGHFAPNEDPDGLFPRVSKQLLDAVYFYVEMGWWTRFDVEALLGRL